MNQNKIVQYNQKLSDVRISNRRYTVLRKDSNGELIISVQPKSEIVGK